MRVTYKGYEDMTEEDWKVHGYKPSYDDYSTYLVISHNGRTIAIHADGGEPEDATFGRDFSWIGDAIESAYEAGLADGREK